MAAGRGHVLPEDFADQLAALLAPGEADGVARVIGAAAALDDDDLTRFLERFADRVRGSSRPLTAAELGSLLPPTPA
ncbi:MAG TPA: hypothetical protein VKF59_18970 [Candidatus Dormibacteraeota bacterium]|nr:hypothetical protein [Candidatus Dormibacteraeota bacterium]